MSKPLIIAEKPDMGRKIAAALAGPMVIKNGYAETKDYLVSWCVGHLLESFKPQEYNSIWEKWDLNTLPITFDKWKVKVVPEKANQFKILSGLLKNAPSVIHAGDPGREGQLIVDEILVYLDYKKPVKRIELFSLDKVSVLTAMKNLKPNSDFYPLYEAAIGRGMADWLLGMNATVAYTLQAQKSGYRGKLPVGRVQSPTVAIVVNRDNAIKNFISHDFYSISAYFSFNDKSFKANWRPGSLTQNSWLDSENRLINLEEANKIVAKIKNKDGFIKVFEEKAGKSAPPLPFNLNNIQIYANNKWGLTAEETLNACQNLYEKHELQTYPRTDCRYLPEIQHGDATNILDNIKGAFQDLSTPVKNANPVLKSPAWNDKEVGEHFGIIPTQKKANISNLSKNELLIYRLVCERYIIQFYPYCEFTTTAVTVECEKEDFKANGKIIQVPGWQGIFDEEQEEVSQDEESNMKFPLIKEGDIGKCIKEVMQSNKTTAPKHFTEATLLAAMTSVHTLVDDPVLKKKLMECKGIGQVATRTGILKKTYESGLLERSGRKILSTPLSQALIKALPHKITNPALTAIWEEALEQISKGKLSLDSFQKKQKEWIAKMVEEAKITTVIVEQSAPPISKNTAVSKSNTPVGKGAVNKNGKPCTKCGKGTMQPKVAKATGKKFQGCSNYPECTHTEWPKK